MTTTRKQKALIILFLFFCGLLLVGGITSTDVDELCDTDGSFLLRLAGVWNCVDRNSAISGDLIPAINDTYILGNSSHKWKELWVSSGTLHIGGVNLTNKNGTLFLQIRNETEIDLSLIGRTYGELWNYTSGGWTLPMDETGIYYDVPGLVEGEVNAFTVTQENRTHGGSYLTAQVEGVYFASGSISFSVGGGGGEYGFQITKNHDTALQRDCYSRRDGTANIGSVSINCIMTLHVGDNVSFRIEDEANPTKDVVIYTLSFNILRRGRI